MEADSSQQHLHIINVLYLKHLKSQAYLRIMAKNLHIPIFAIDYRLAPKTQFPFNFEDTLTGIFWIFQFVKEVLGASVEEYILLGDSAGGNLCVSICQWLIESGIDFLPKMISLAYPVLSLE
jgi:acetyl esterase/lipase